MNSRRTSSVYWLICAAAFAVFGSSRFSGTSLPTGTKVIAAELRQ